MVDPASAQYNFQREFYSVSFLLPPGEEAECFSPDSASRVK
jgi:hypothetical protein